MHARILRSSDARVCTSTHVVCTGCARMHISLDGDSCVVPLEGYMYPDGALMQVFAPILGNAEVGMKLPKR